MKIFDFKKDKAWLDNLALVTQLGLTMAGSILFCLAIGYFLDKWLGTKGLFITVFILLGVAGGGYTAYRQIMEATKTDGEKKR
ncbi:MAG: AtpZ/AtpI family protein [Desulfobacteraceae bacterium]